MTQERGIDIASALLPHEKAKADARLSRLGKMLYTKSATPSTSRQLIAKFEDGLEYIPWPQDVDFNLLAELFDLDPTHRACCVLKARALSAGGWRLVRRDGTPGDPPKDLRRYIERVFPDGLEEFLYRAELELAAMGNVYLEVRRTLDGRFAGGLGQVAALEVIPTFTMYRLPPTHRSGCAYVQRWGGWRVFFRAFGTDSPTHLENQPVVNEVIHIMTPSPSSYWYGVPEIVGALRASYGWLVGMDYATAILEKRGMPHYLLLLPGGKGLISLEDQTVFNRFVNELLTVGAGRILMAALPQGVEAKLEQLNLNIPIEELGNFLSECRNQIARVHGVPPRLLAILESGRLGGTNEGRTQIEQFKAFTIRPLQKMWENRLYSALLAGRESWADWKIELQEFDFEDVVRRMQADTNYVKTGIKSIDEVRSSLGLKPRGVDRLFFVLGGEPTPVDWLESDELLGQKASTKVQSVLCSKKRFKSAKEAAQWCRDHDFKASDLDETDEYYRFRQFEPSRCKEGSFRTIELTDGVKAVICQPKSKAADCC